MYLFIDKLLFKITLLQASVRSVPFLFSFVCGVCVVLLTSSARKGYPTAMFVLVCFSSEVTSSAALWKVTQNWSSATVEVPFFIFPLSKL